MLPLSMPSNVIPFRAPHPYTNKYATFLVSFDEIRRVNPVPFATQAEADELTTNSNDALALIYVPPEGTAHYETRRFDGTEWVQII